MQDIRCSGLKARSWGASTPIKMCIQADLDATDALRHINKNNSERPVCSTHLLAPISTSFLFVFDTELVMSTCEHQGRDTVLQTGVKIFWSRRSASTCFNRVWRVRKSSAKHQSMLRHWVLQHQPWPSPSAWTILLLILDRSDVCSPLLCVFRLNFAPKLTCRAKRKRKHLLCSHRHTTVIAGPTCLIAHLLAPHDRAFSHSFIISVRWRYQDISLIVCSVCLSAQQMGMKRLHPLCTL